MYGEEGDFCGLPSHDYDASKEGSEEEKRDRPILQHHAFESSGIPPRIKSKDTLCASVKRVGGRKSQLHGL